MLKLTKMIPAHRKTECFTLIKRNFLTMNEAYREVRSRMSKKMDTCFWCKHKIQDGDSIALGMREKGVNVVLCDSCAEEALYGSLLAPEAVIECISRTGEDYCQACGRAWEGHRERCEGSAGGK